MNKEKLISLIKYRDTLQDRLKDTIPEKHKNRADAYLAFIKNELAAVNATIASAKEEGVK